MLPQKTWKNRKVEKLGGLEEVAAYAGEDWAEQDDEDGTAKSAFLRVKVK